MFSAAFVRSARRRVPTLARCTRWQSTTSIPSSSRSGEVRLEKNSQLIQEGVDLPSASTPAGEVETGIPEEIADALEVPPEYVGPKLADGGAEMFGKQEKFNYQSLGLKYDPTQLPVKRDLNPWKQAFTEEEFAMTLVHGRSVHEPYLHPRTHDIPVANIHFRSHHVELLNLFTHFALHAASSLGIPTSGVASLPTKRTLWTVPRSPFVHKKSQENFERKVHKRAIKAWDADAEVVQRWLAYLRKHALFGVGMKVTIWERVPLGIGNAKVTFKAGDESNTMLEVPEKIKRLGGKIVEEEQANTMKA